MSYLVQSCEGPSGLSIVIVDHDDGSDFVGNCVSAERLNGDIGVMASEIPKKKDKYAGLLDPRPEICKRVFDRVLATEFPEAKFNLLDDVLGKSFRGEVDVG